MVTAMSSTAARTSSENDGEKRVVAIAGLNGREDSPLPQPGALPWIDPEQPAGLRRMEAITVVWTKKWLIAAYCLIWLISFTDSLQQQASYAWTPYVTSDFMLHGLTGITGVVSGLIGGVSKLPLAKFIDVVGRPHGFFLCLVSVIIALVLMASCRNVQTYAAAQVFYWTGMNGIAYVLNIFIADTSKLKNRAIWFAFTSTPYICNTFAGPELGQTFLENSTWRWGYGTFTIVTPLMCIPFWAIFFLMSRRAKHREVFVDKWSERTWWQSIWHWCIVFDVVGLLLACAGFSIFLLPFSLAAYQTGDWKSPMVISMIAIGLALLALFVIWEKFFAPMTFFPFHLIADRSVIAACFLGANTWIAFYSYKMYFSSYLQVVFQLSVAKAGYVTNIFNLVSCAWSVIISFAFKYSDRYKWAAICCIPIQLLMTGLMIDFRQPNTPIGLLVMIEVFGSMCGGTLVMVEQLAVMAAVPHENLAVGLALLSMITSDDIKDQTPTIYASLTAQLSYPWGSPARQAIVRAYGDAQKLMVITGSCALVPCFIWVVMLKNYRLSERGARQGLLA